MADPLTAECPDCQAPPEVQCRGALGTHAERQRVADLRNLEHGTCALCGQPMVRGSVEGAPVDAWHPDPDHATACPVFPHPHADWDGYAEMINAGLTPGHPGVQHFTPDPPTT